jgi:hypothetical protein
MAEASTNLPAKRENVHQERKVPDAVTMAKHAIAKDEVEKSEE